MKQLIRESVTRLSGYVPGEQPQGTNIVKLNTNENPYPPSPEVVQAIQSFDAEALRRYPDPVGSQLRDRIAELHRCSAEQVFVGNGSDEVLALCTRAFVENDGSIGFFDPSYSLYPVLSEIRDVEQRVVSLGVDFDWQMADDYHCSLFFLANPNAPTGMLFDKQTVGAFAERLSGVVVVDEAYVDFADDNCADLALQCENVLVSRTLSKSYSLAGLRVGYAVGPAPLVDALMKLKDSYNLDAISQRLALAALSNVEYMQSNAQRIRATRQRLSDALESMRFRVYPSDANFVWVAPTDVTALELFEYLAHKRILVRYFAGERTDQFVRISIGTDDEIDKLLDAISAM